MQRVSLTNLTCKSTRWFYKRSKSKLTLNYTRSTLATTDNSNLSIKCKICLKWTRVNKICFNSSLISINNLNSKLQDLLLLKTLDWLLTYLMLTWCLFLSMKLRVKLLLIRMLSSKVTILIINFKPNNNNKQSIPNLKIKINNRITNPMHKPNLLNKRKRRRKRLLVNM